MKDRDLYNFFRKVGAVNLKNQRMLIAALPEIFSRRLYKKYGYASIHEFGAKLAGLSYNVVNEALRVHEKIKDKPELQKQLISQGLNKIRVVANIATPETDKEWAEKVSTMTKSALEIHVRDIRKSHPGMESLNSAINNSAQQQGQNQLFNDSFESSTVDYMSSYDAFTVKLDPKIIQKLQIIKAKMPKGTTWNDVFAHLAKLAEPKPKREYKQMPHKSRNIPAKLKREMPKICEVAGCNKPAIEIHHLDRWSLTKKHDNLKALCKAHHELVHRGYLDEENNLKPLLKAMANPIKALVDQKMLNYLSDA